MKIELALDARTWT